MPATLSVNLNAVAQLRNRRTLPWPSVREMGRIALSAGAHGLTVHPRPDERHTRRADLPVLRALIDDLYPKAEFNIEGYPAEAFLQLVEETEPDQVTLVPDDPAQATSDHGFDLPARADFLEPIVRRLKSKGFRVSIFVDPDARGVETAARIGADRIELYTGPYGATYDDPAAAKREIERLKRTAEAARDCGLAVNAGHDLTVDNLPPLAEAIPHLAEVSIGHGLTADALIHGMEETVRRFLRALGRKTP